MGEKMDGMGEKMDDKGGSRDRGEGDAVPSIFRVRGDAARNILVIPLLLTLAGVLTTFFFNSNSTLDTRIARAEQRADAVGASVESRVTASLQSFQTNVEKTFTELRDWMEKKILRLEDKTDSRFQEVERRIQQLELRKK